MKHKVGQIPVGVHKGQGQLFETEDIRKIHKLKADLTFCHPLDPSGKNQIRYNFAAVPTDKPIAASEVEDVCCSLLSSFLSGDVKLNIFPMPKGKHLGKLLKGIIQSVSTDGHTNLGGYCHHRDTGGQVWTLDGKEEWQPTP